MEDKIVIDFNKNPAAKEAMLKFIAYLEGKNDETTQNNSYKQMKEGEQ